MKKNVDGFAIAGLVLGIISVVFTFLFIWIGLVCGIVGIILSVKGMKSTTKKGMASAGLSLSIIGTILSGGLIVCAICYFVCTGAVATGL